MTTSFNQPAQASRGASPAVAVVVGLVTVVAVFALITAGFTFFGLAIAFPIAVPVAEAYHMPIRAADAALAQQFAGFWWVFAGLAVASFVAAAAVIVGVVRFLSPRD
jgi:hypothetical protein